MSSPEDLKRSVQARDRLALQAELAGQALEQQLRHALQGALAAEVTPRDDALREGAQSLAALAENLRIYQAELHAQADELALSQARAEALVQRFTALFMHMPVAALRVGEHGEIVDYNARAARLLGLDRRARPVRFLHRLVDKLHYQSRVRPAFLEARAAGASAVDGVRLLPADAARDGEAAATAPEATLLAELHIAWLPDLATAQAARGDAEGARRSATATASDAAPYVCAIVDRTEQLHTLQALRTSTEALQASGAFLSESARLARIGGWEFALRPRRWHLAPELQRLLDLPEQADEEGLLACVAPAQRDALARALAAAERGQAFELELDMRSAGGQPLRMLAVGQPVSEAATPGAGATEPPVQRIRGVLQDITGPAQARAQISDLTERLSVANAAGGIGVWDWDLGTHEVLLDARMAQLLDLDGPGTQPARKVRALLAGMLTPSESARLVAGLKGLLRHGGTLNTELCRAGGAPGGIERWLHLSARLHHGADGQAQRVVGAAWDSSAEHEAARLLAAKESAEAANRSKSAFLSRMSHELRTPLNAILGFAQLMRIEAASGDLVLKPHRVQLIETAARHLLDLVNEVLDVTQVESGQIQVQSVVLDLREVVRETLPMVLGLAERQGVRLHDGTQAAGVSTALGDRLRLKEVLINLLSNAVKYNRSGGSVEVLVQSAPGGQAVDLVVSDTGLGLDERQVKDLFQPFNRVGAEGSGVEGTGLGLFVSRRFVELMGGQILVHSTPGQGSRFTVRLPAAMDASDPASALVAAA